MHADVNGHPLLVLGSWDRFIESKKVQQLGFFIFVLNLWGFLLLGVFPHGR
jgi:hypothetical protein